MAEMDPQTTSAEQSADLRMDERRLVGRALACWEASRGGREFPNRADFDAIIHGRLAGATFLVAVGDDAYSDKVVESDDALRDALQLEPIGRKMVDIMPSSTEKGLSFSRAAAELKKPIADVGHFTNSNGEDVYYRSVLLPLSDDQENINYLLGAFSYKTVN